MTIGISRHLVAPMTLIEVLLGHPTFLKAFCFAAVLF